MYLKRLDLSGFKTFAEESKLEFQPGVTAVVGPNGSGKSNLADALMWVMGERSEPPSHEVFDLVPVGRCRRPDADRRRVPGGCSEGLVSREW